MVHSMREKYCWVKSDKYRKECCRCLSIHARQKFTQKRIWQIRLIPKEFGTEYLCWALKDEH